jgi:CRP-like cAMP-binding protein
MEPSFLHRFSLHVSPLIVPMETELLPQNLAVQDVYWIEQGLVKLARVDETGRELIGAIRGPGAVLGVSSALTQSPMSLMAETLTHCRLLRLPAAEFRQLAQTQADFAYATLLTLCRRAFDDTDHFFQLGIPEARARLLSFLAQFLSDGSPLKSGEIQLHIPLKDSDVAKYLALDRSTLSKLYRRLTTEGILRRQKGRTVVSRPQLLRAADAVAASVECHRAGIDDGELKRM